MTHTATVDIGADKEVFAGEDKTITFTVRDDADVVVNVSSWTFLWELRLTRHNPNVILQKTSSPPSGITFATDGTDGKVRVALTSSETKNLKAGTYFHGLARTNGGAFDVNGEGEFVLRKAAVHAP